MIQFDEHIFQMGWFNHQLVSVVSEDDEKSGHVVGFLVKETDFQENGLKILELGELFYPMTDHF